MVPVEEAMAGRFMKNMLGEEEVPDVCLLYLISKHTGIVIINPTMMTNEFHKESL